MANTVTFKIKIEGSNDLRSVTVDANELGKAFDAVQANVKGLKSELVTLSSTVQLIEGVSSAVSQLNGILSGLSSAYTAQESAETRLAQAMRNTMGASDSEIQAIKDLTAAQQEIGIVGDEVQLAAAQELATYLEFSDSLKTIIPVLNDMIAQQLGLGASAESATQIATMLGKVMNGQTEALSRYGYKFDDAQKQILKYGEESERAAVLADVVSEAVGGMNKAMANTSSGRIQQVSNAIGDMKEKLGQAVQGAMPFISTLSEITMAASGIGKLAAAFQALGKSQTFAKAQAVALSAAQRVQAALTKTVTIAQKQASVATKALAIDMAALEAAMTMGLSIVITAIIALIAKLASKSKDAAGAVEEVDEASEAFTQAAKDARSELAMYQVKLEDIIKHHKNDATAVKELNDKYGKSFGYYNTAATWYDVLTRKSAVYCRQVGYEAQARVIASQRAQKQLEQDAVKERLLQLKREGKDSQKKVFGLVHDADGKVVGWGTEYRYENKEYEGLIKHYNDLGEEIDGLGKKFTSCTQGMAAAQQELQSALDRTDAAAGWQQMSLEQLTKAIKDQKAVVESLAGVDDKQARKENKKLKQMEARKMMLEGKYDLGSSSDKDKYDGSKFIENASSYKELGNNIKFYQNKLEDANDTDTEAIQLYSRKITELQKQQAAIKAAADAASVRVEYNSLEDINNAITFQRNLRSKAKAEDIAGIDEQIKHLNTLKVAFETGFDPSDEKAAITTYAQLEAAIQYCNDTLQDAAEGDRKAIQARINSLEELRKKWDEAAAELKAPGEIGTLNSIEKLDEAISYYQAKQKKAKAEEVAGIQETILALQAKRKMMENISSLPEMQLELSGLEGLSDKRLKLELELIGLDGIKDRIRSLQKMLDDTKNPLDNTQRAQVEALIGSYTKYQKILQKSNVTLADGWAGVKGIGDSIKNLTETLQGDGDAWEKVSGIIDNTLALYESFKGVIELIQMLTTVVNAHTLAKKAEGDENLIEAGKAAAAASIEIGASEAVTIAKTTEAGAKTLDAGAGAASAVSSIPYVGPILAVAALASVIAAIMAIPKFANGGIAYGPTVGLFGEAGPEAIVPLDRLPDLIPGPDGGNFRVDFRIRGRDLRGLLVKEEQIGLRVA